MKTMFQSGPMDWLAMWWWHFAMVSLTMTIGAHHSSRMFKSYLLICPGESHAAPEEDEEKSRQYKRHLDISMSIQRHLHASMYSQERHMVKGISLRGLSLKLLLYQPSFASRFGCKSNWKGIHFAQLSWTSLLYDKKLWPMKNPGKFEIGLRATHLFLLYFERSLYVFVFVFVFSFVFAFFPTIPWTVSLCLCIFFLFVFCSTAPWTVSLCLCRVSCNGAQSGTALPRHRQYRPQPKMRFG